MLNNTDWTTIELTVPVLRPFYALAVFGVIIFVAAWLATHWRKVPKWLPVWSEKPAMNAVLWGAVALAPIWLYFFAEVLLMLTGLGTTPSTALAENPIANRLHFLAYVGLLGALGGLLAMPISLVRILATERQTTVQEDSHVTDQINKAVEGLGAEKTISRMGRTVTYRQEIDGKIVEREDMHWRDNDAPLNTETISPPSYGDWTIFSETKPNLEVRIGAIFALERIARHNLDEHIQIMEILCAYIRENAPAKYEPNFPELQIKITEDSHGGDSHILQQKDNWINEHHETVVRYGVRADIQAALTVIGRRTMRQKKREWGDWKPLPVTDNRISRDTDIINDIEEINLFEWKTGNPIFRLDLRNSNLNGADISARQNEADFSLARFNGSRLRSADFRGATVQRADFSRAYLHIANLRNARLQGALFSETLMPGVFMSSADIRCAKFFRADLQFADLSQSIAIQASLADSNLRGADFLLADTRYADFSRADLSMCVLNACLAPMANFSEAKLWRVRVDNKTRFDSAEFELAAIKADLSESRISQKQIDSMFGDQFTAQNLPEGLRKPDHWLQTDVPEFNIFFFEKKFSGEWNAWKASSARYIS